LDTHYAAFSMVFGLTQSEMNMEILILRHIWPMICPVCRYHNPVLSWRIIGVVTWVTWRWLLMEQKLNLHVAAHEFIPVSWWDSFCPVLNFLCNVMTTIVRPFALFPLINIALSFLLRIMASDFLFGIFKLFFINC
jgi:hypothetical protein